MIRFALKCPEGHEFESWFQSGSAFDSLCHAGRVSCPVCGSTRIEKSLMAPMVSVARGVGAGALDVPAQGAADSHGDARQRAIARLRAEIEANSDYVGQDFVAEARRMHSGDVPERAIHGEARLDEARKLIEEGVPVTPLPFLPRRKVN